MQDVAQFVFSDETLRSIIEYMPEAIAVVDCEGRFVLFNRAAAQILPTGPQDVATGSLSEGVFLPDRVTRCLPEDLPLARALQGESVRDRELFMRNAHKPRGCWVHASASTLRDSDGALIGAILVYRDVSERKEAELQRDLLHRAVLESEEVHRLLSESVPQLVWRCRADGYCDYLNSRWEEYTGLPETEHLGYNWINALHPDDRERTREAWMAAVRGECAYDIEYRMRNADGEYRWFKARASAVHNSSGQIVRWFGTSTDIDDQKRIEEKLAQQSEVLARSNAELQEFAYIVAHDLREPLRTIGGFTQLLARKLPDDVKAARGELLRHIESGVERMDALIGGLLAYAIVSGKEAERRPVACDSVLQSALLDVAGTVQETEATIISGPLPTVLGDEIALVQLFQNLIGNALKYRGTEPPRIEIRAEQCGACWQFQVKDNGLGIDREYHEEIFGLFKRAHSRKFEGIGLGLAYCKRIVEKHRGRIWVESEPGKGSTFFFALPAEGV